MSEHKPHDIELLITRHLDGELQPGELEELERWLCADPANADRFARRMIDHHRLHELAAVQPLVLVSKGLEEADFLTPSGHDVEDQGLLRAMQALQQGQEDAEPVDLTERLKAEALEKNRLEQLRRARSLALSGQAQSGGGRRGPWLPIAAGLLGIAAVMGLMVWLGLPDDAAAPATLNDPSAQAPLAPAPAAEVATLVSAVNARWNGQRDADLTEFKQGDLVSLADGLAQLQFKDGAVVIIQAPATFEATGTNGLRLISGRITATIPDRAHGFTVMTPGGRITDYGTEFGVIVGPDGRTLAQTFSGRIGLKPNGAAEVNLHAGDAVEVSTDGQLQEVAYNSLLVVRDEEYSARRALADDASGYARWLAYSYDLRRDPDVLIYYAFAGLADSTSAIPNDAQGHEARRLDATVQASGTAPGRFEQKPTVQLARDTDFVAAEMDRELSAVTLAGWFWIDEMRGEFSSLFNSKGTAEVADYVGGIHWHINRVRARGLVDSWSIDFGQARHRVAAPGAWSDLASTGWQPETLSRRWVHLAMSFDSETGDSRLYVDGREVARSQAQDAVPIRLGQFHLGNWDAAGTVPGLDRVRPLRGRIDEFVIVGRVLTPAEITAMHRAGLPEQP